MSYIGYLHHDELGTKYGILPVRPLGFLGSILVNIPLLNLLYTKKIGVEITSRFGVQPAYGIFNKFRIFRNTKTLKFKAKVYETFHNILVVIDTSKSESWFSPASFDGKELYPWHEYHFRVNFNKSMDKSTLEMTDDAPEKA